MPLQVLRVDRHRDLPFHDNLQVMAVNSVKLGFGPASDFCSIACLFDTDCRLPSTTWHVPTASRPACWAASSVPGCCTNLRTHRTHQRSRHRSAQPSTIFSAATGASSTTTYRTHQAPAAVIQASIAAPATTARKAAAPSRPTAAVSHTRLRGRRCRCSSERRCSGSHSRGRQQPRCVDVTVVWPGGGLR